MRKEQGFSIVEVGIIMVVVIIIGALGVVGYNRLTHNDAVKSNTPSQQTSSTVPEIKTTKDLDNAAKVIDDTDFATTNADVDRLSSESSAF